MGNFSYANEFYKRGICNLNNINQFKKFVKEAESIELYFIERVPLLDELREAILISYKLNKGFRTFKNRINHIRGIVYAKHYIDESDIELFIDNIESSDKTEYEKRTVFSQINYEDDLYDGVILDIMRKKDISKKELEIDFYNFPDIQKKIMDEKEMATCTINEDDYKDDFDFKNDFFEDKFKLDLIDPVDKLAIMNEGFSDYVKLMLNDKKITDKNERLYIRKGMYDWYNYMYNKLNDVLEEYTNEDANQLLFKII